MVYGVLLLLDALGTQVSDNELESKVLNFDKVDQKIKKDTKRLRFKLGSYGYNSLIISGSIYDNFQIFLPFDLHIPRYVDYTGKNDFWWNIITMGNLSIDIFRYALVNNIPLRGCITSGYGVVSKSKRILGPIANQASKFYEIADWLGIIASNHTAIILNNKVAVNPNLETFEPFIKHIVPVKKCSVKQITNEEYWAVRWPIQQGFEGMESEKLIYVIPSTKKTYYGKIIKNSELEAVIHEGVNNSNPSISQKWKHALDFYTRIINNNN